MATTTKETSDMNSPDAFNLKHLLESEIETLRHMLGAEGRYAKCDWGFRNYYCAEASDKKTLARLDAIVAKGYAVKGRPASHNQYYYATKQTAEFLGLKKKRIKEMFP